MSGGIFGLAMLVAVVAIIAWLLFNGLRSGSIRGRISRAEQPRQFWLLAALYVVGLIVALALLAHFARGYLHVM